ncbi:MAG: ATP-binding protein [Candidatus Latescibacterota bacterium]
MRISTKLILLLVSAVSAVMAAYALVTVSRTQDRLDEELRKMGEHVGMALGVGLLHHLESGDVDGVRDVLQIASQHADILGVAVYDPQGMLLSASGSFAAPEAGQGQHAGHEGAEAARSGQAPQARQVYTYRMDVRDAAGTLHGVLQLALGGQSLLPYVIEARNYILITIVGLTGVLSALIVYFSQTQIAGPLRVLAEGARAIGEGSLRHRIQLAAGGEVGELAGAFNRMAASLQASTEQIIAEREYIRSIVDSISEGIAVVDRGGRITAWNHTMEQRHGPRREEALGRPLQDVLPDLESHRLPEALVRLLGGQAPQLALERVKLESAPGRTFALTGSPLRDARQQSHGAVLVLADVTERLALEQQIQQSEKLAAVGQLAAGVAHEIGTPLNVISGSAEYLLMDTPEGQGAGDELRTIVSEVERISALVEQLMAFARRETPREEAVAVGEVVEGILVLTRRQIEKQGIAVEVDLEPDLPPLAGDRNQIQQVLLNLIMNAWQAMPQGGRRAVRARRPPAAAGPRGAAAGCVELTVADTGTGICEKDLERIFEPFFTTKDVGQGTGLGLAIVQRIVENHGGQVEVASRPGQGTVFTVHLPAYGEERTHG